jgi:hypothetical protein
LFLLLSQLLGIAGYEALLRAPTEALADKLLQLIKYFSFVSAISCWFLSDIKC